MFVQVYVMPSYMMEGMILLGIAAGLILIFVLCALHTFHQKDLHKQNLKAKAAKAQGAKKEQQERVETVL